MDKVLVEVYVPVLGRSFDMFIPARLPLHQVLGLIKKAVAELSDGAFAADDSTVLSRRNDGAILNINLSACEQGICNGSKLMLI